MKDPSGRVLLLDRDDAHLRRTVIGFNDVVCVPFMSNVIAFTRPQPAAQAPKPHDSEAYQATVEGAIASLSDLIDDLGEKISQSSNEAEIESLTRIRGTVYIALLTADAERMGQLDFSA